MFRAAVMSVAISGSVGQQAGTQKQERHPNSACNTAQRLVAALQNRKPLQSMQIGGGQTRLAKIVTRGTHGIPPCVPTPRPVRRIVELTAPMKNTPTLTVCLRMRPN